MTALRLYIAGPMTGLTQLNYPAFNAAEAALRTAGHDPINPARTEGREDCASWLDYMRASLRDLADADGVALLPDWKTSRGARLEEHIARALCLPTREIDAWLTERAS
jgi:Domain of unknown function (DUF4406)